MKIASEVSANELLAGFLLAFKGKKESESVCEMKSSVMASVFGEGRRSVWEKSTQCCWKLSKCDQNMSPEKRLDRKSTNTATVAN